jgi:hypothetical protein
MGSSFLGVIISIATVSLIAFVTRWLFNSKGTQLPKTHDGSSVYGIKWQWRVIGIGGGVFWIIISIWFWLDQRSRPDGVLISITFAFLTLGLWLSSGSITTNREGITKRGLWYSRSFRWKEVTEIRLHEKQGGAIELHSGARKLVIDSRFDALYHLLNEIEDHTQMHPIVGP